MTDEALDKDWSAPIEVAFPYSDRYWTGFSTFEKLAGSPNSPGIYAWFWRPRNMASPASITSIIGRLFENTRYEVQMTGHLRQFYKGTLSRQAVASSEYVETSQPERLETELLKQSIFAFGHPIYIGISKNLQARLSTHARMLQGAIRDSEIVDEPEGAREIDNDAESASFGGRMAKLLASAGTDYVDALFVKYICLEDLGLGDLKDEDQRQLLLRVERLLNDLLCPVLGRR